MRQTKTLEAICGVSVGLGLGCRDPFDAFRPRRWRAGQSVGETYAESVQRRADEATQTVVAILMAPTVAARAKSAEMAAVAREVKAAKMAALAAQWRVFVELQQETLDDGLEAASNALGTMAAATGNALSVVGKGAGDALGAFLGFKPGNVLEGGWLLAAMVIVGGVYFLTASGTQAGIAGLYGGAGKGIAAIGAGVGAGTARSPIRFG